MLYWALVFIILSIVAGTMGFGGVAFMTAEIAQIIFFVFLVLSVVSIVSHLISRNTNNLTKKL